MSQPPPRCRAHSTRTGEPCKRFPTRGATVCSTHGAASPVVKRAAARRVEEARILRLLGREQPVERVDPAAALADVIATAEAFRRVVQDRLSELSSVSSRDRQDVERARTLVEVFERSLDRSGRLLVNVLHLGLHERAVRVEEAQVEILISLLTTAMERVNVLPSVRAALWAALRAEIDAQAAVEPERLAVPARRQIEGGGR